MNHPTEILPRTADHVLVLENRSAGSGSKRRDLDWMATRLRAERFTVTVDHQLARVAEHARQLHIDGRLRAVVGAGGDGTMHVLLNHMPNGAPLAMLPRGTENLLAKFLEQDRRPESLVAMILGGHIARLDAGRAGDRLFLLMASAGFDADVTRRLHASRSGNIRHTTYLRPIFDTIRQYEYPLMRIQVDTLDGHRTIEARWCFIFNLPQYGFGMRFIPEADGADGLLDLCTFQQGSLWHALRYTAHVYCGLHRELAGCDIVRGSRIRIESDEPVPFQLDGDPVGWLPQELDIVPGRLTLIVPS